jgi:hypothetical protein
MTKFYATQIIYITTENGTVVKSHKTSSAEIEASSKEEALDKIIDKFNEGK